MKRALTLIVMLTFVLGITGLAFSSAKVIEGTITKIDGNKVTIKQADGKEVTVEVEDVKGLKVGSKGKAELIDAIAKKAKKVEVEKK